MTIDIAEGRHISDARIWAPRNIAGRSMLMNNVADQQQQLGKMAATILRLNFRGVNVELDVQVLHRAPESRLHRLAHGREKLPLDNEGRHFIDRSPLLFHHILDYYSTGILDFPAQYSWQEVQEEIQYWQVLALYPIHCKKAPYLSLICNRVLLILWCHSIGFVMVHW